MAKNLLVDSKVTEFRPDDSGAAIVLHPYVATVQDKLAPRLAMHEFMKVDGGQVEYMGKSPNEYRFALNFVGPDWRTQYVNLAARLDKQCKGILTHPAFGDIRVACRGLDGAAIDVAQAVNAIMVPISFVDDNVDTRRQLETAPSVAVTVSAVDAAILDVQAQTLPFTASTTQVAALVGAATACATAITLASEDNTESPQIAALLNAVADTTNIAITALEADPYNTEPATAYAAVASCEVLAASCADASQALRDSRPPLILYTVSAETDVLTLASLLYGAQASSRVDEILQLNPRLNPYLIPSGAVLSLSTPTLV